MESTNQPYLFPEVQPGESLAGVEPIAAPARGRELSPARVLLHVSLLAVTAVSTTLTGAAMAAPPLASSESLVAELLAPLVAVFAETAAGNFGPLTSGLLFTFTILLILGAHEMGHYFACRHYGIKATLPFFIPAPPMVSLFGTFGAVIKIKEPITTRRALFDIGIAGPLAGFAFAVPASVVGLLMTTPAEPVAGAGIVFHDPPLFIIIIKLLGLPSYFEWNPVYWAAWGTLLVTALNLFPVGQLDGGHVVYAVAGRRAHKWVSRLTCAAVALLAAVSFVFYDSPIWFLWTLVLLFLLRVGHPPLIEEEPLGTKRLALAALAAVVFLLCFMPFPITVN